MGLFDFLKKGKAEEHDMYSVPAKMDVSFDMPDTVRVRGTTYFQSELAAIPGDTVTVFIVGKKKVKRVSVNWDFDRENEQFIVDSRGVMIGYLDYDDIQKTGYSLGDTVQAVVRKPPQYGNVYSLFIPQNEKGKEYVINKHERLAHERMEQRIGGLIPKNAEIIAFNIYGNNWVASQDIEIIRDAQLHAEYLPVPKGSKAKPRIVMKDGDRDLFECGARNGFYSDLAQHIGDRPRISTIKRLLSDYDDSDYYWQVTLAY